MSRRLITLIIITLMLVLIISKNIDADNHQVLLGRHQLQLERGNPVYKVICRCEYSNDSFRPDPVWNSISRGDKFNFDKYRPYCRRKEKFKIGDNEYDIEAGYGYLKVSLNDEVLINSENPFALKNFSINIKKWQEEPYEFKSSYTKKHEFIDRQIERQIMVFHEYEHVAGFESRKQGNIYEPTGYAYIDLSSKVSMGIADQLTVKKQYRKIEIKFIVYDTDFDGKFTNSDRFSLDYYNTLFEFGEKVKISLPKRSIFFGVKVLDKKNTYCYIVNLIDENGNYFLEVKPAND